MSGFDAVIAALAGVAALVARPWRAWPAGRLPWPWLAWCMALPLMWSADRMAETGVLQPLSGACLLMLMTGWPTAVLALWPVALAAAWLADLDASQALARMVWLGVVPATVAFAFGAALRRWLPRHLFVYILGRGFFCTALAGSLAGWASAWLHPIPHGLLHADVVLARWLAAWGDAFITGMMAAIFVALRPQWLATYADRLYLPPAPDDGRPRR